MAQRISIKIPAHCKQLLSQPTSSRIRPGKGVLSSVNNNYFSTSSPPIESIRSRGAASPLSALPNGALLRSLCINGITSQRWLLAPAISFTNFISKPGRSTLFNVDRNMFLAWITKTLLYKQFCAGETVAEVKATMDTIRGMGFRGTILTYAQETVFDYRDGKPITMCSKSLPEDETEVCQVIKAWRDGTMKTVEMLEEGDQLAIKVTGAGSSVTEALAAGRPIPQQMQDALEEISARCKERKSHILIDAESQMYQAGISKLGLDLMRRYNRDGHAVIYNTYQAYLKSTPSTLAKHLADASKEGFTLGLKLVRGAYLASDPRSLIHDTKEETDRAYDQIAQGALRQEVCGFGGASGHPFPDVNLVLASHNKNSVFAAHELHQQRLREGLPTVPVKFAQLQGMSDELSFGLLHLTRNDSRGPEVYKCSTWGSLSECLGYLARRATENRDAASRTMDAYAALRKEAKRRVMAICSLSPRN